MFLKFTIRKIIFAYVMHFQHLKKFSIAFKIFALGVNLKFHSFRYLIFFQKKKKKRKKIASLIFFKSCLAPLTLPFVSLFYVAAVAMGIFPVAMELLLFKLPWLPCVVSRECEALPARYPLYVVVVVLRIWLLWLPQFGGGSPWWLQNTWRGAVHLLPCSLQN